MSALPDVAILRSFDEEAAALRVRVTELRAEIRVLALSDAADTYTRRSIAREELDAIPVMLADVARRRAAAHLQWLTDRAAEATIEFERLEAQEESLRLSMGEHTKAAAMALTLRKPEEQARELQAARAIDADRRKLDIEIARVKGILVYCYSKARTRYACRLDDSAFETWANKPWAAQHPLAAPGSWEHIAGREAMTAEQNARAELGSAFQ